MTDRGNTPAQEPPTVEDIARIGHQAFWLPDHDMPWPPASETYHRAWLQVGQAIRAALSGVPVERPETTWYECSKCGYAYPERGGWAHKESTGHWPPADSPVRLPVEPPATPGLRE